MFDFIDSSNPVSLIANAGSIDTPAEIPDEYQLEIYRLRRRVTELEFTIRGKDQRIVRAIAMLEDELQMFRTLMYDHIAETHGGIQRRMAHLIATLNYLKDINYPAPPLEIPKRWRKTEATLKTFIIGACLFLSACAGPGGGPGFRMRVNPAIYGTDATMMQWADAHDRWQIEYVAAIVEAHNQSGIRCPGPSAPTVGNIRHELMTRAIQGRTVANDKVYDQINKILAERGCGTDTGTGFIPLSAK